jgi:hypothetical protein
MLSRIIRTHRAIILRFVAVDTCLQLTVAMILTVARCSPWACMSQAVRTTRLNGGSQTACGVSTACRSHFPFFKCVCTSICATDHIQQRCLAFVSLHIFDH